MQPKVQDPCGFLKIQGVLDAHQKVFIGLVLGQGTIHHQESPWASQYKFG